MQIHSFDETRGESKCQIVLRAGPDPGSTESLDPAEPWTGFAYYKIAPISAGQELSFSPYPRVPFIFQKNTQGAKNKGFGFSNLDSF